MGDTSIRVSDEAKKRLELIKREGESFDDVIVRLTRTDRWAGFGVLANADTDTREGLERMRRRMREGVEHDIDESEA
jgi:predicted CopG family antitoxin